MFRKRLLLIVLSMILGMTPILQSIPVFATESSVLTEKISLYIQMMQKQKENFAKNGSAEYVSGLRMDDCVLIDLEWISNKLGLLIEIVEIKQKEESSVEDMSYDIRKYQEGQEKVFANDTAKKEIRIRKTGNSYLQFVLRTGSEKAYAYSPHLGEIVADLGAEVTEQDEKIYVPFTMFLNLFDSYYILDEEKVINLYPCETTVTDILHMTGLTDYYFDVIEESGLSELEMATVAGYDNFYRKIKALFQGVVQLDVETLMKAMPNDKSVISELLSKMLFASSNDEFEKIANASAISSNLSILTTDFINSQVKDGVENTLEETIRKWSEQRQSRIQSTGFSSIDDALEFERQAAADIAREKSVSVNIENSCKRLKLGTNLANIGFSVFVKYATLVSEINSTEIFYVNAVKEYINRYSKMRYPLVEKSIINDIEEKAEIYEKKETNPFKNSALLDEIFKTVGNTTKSLALNDVADYVVKQVGKIYPSLEIDEFCKTWVQLQAVSIGWDVAEFFINEGTQGSLEALDGLHASLYAMLLQTDAYNALKSIDSYQDLDEYRKLEWVRLRSYYITRQLLLMFYQPQQLRYPKEYEIATAPIKDEINELIELMTVLAVGPVGLSQEKLNEVSEMRSELDKEILEMALRRENGINLEDENFTKISRKNYFNADGELIYYESYAYYDNSLLCSTTLHSVDYWSDGTVSALEEYTLLYLYDENGKLADISLDVFFFGEGYNEDTGEIVLNNGYDEDGYSSEIYIYPKEESIEQEKFGVDSSKTEEIYGYVPIINADTSGGWAKAYLDNIFVGEEPTDMTSCRMIYVDDNSVPELWIDYGYGYAGAEVYTHKSNGIDKIYMNHGSAMWSGKENLLLVSGGHMGEFYDRVYKIQDGEFILIGTGTYSMEDDEQGNIGFCEFYWNDSKVTDVEYEQYLNNIFDESKSVDINQNIYTYDQCKLLLQTIAEKEVSFASEETMKKTELLIPSDAESFAGHHYKFFTHDSAKNWDNIKSYCENMGGYLSIIDSEEENDFLFQLMTDAGYGSAYFGITDCEKEGSWEWVDGTVPTYTNWHSGEPNSQNTSEDYGMFYWKFIDGTWNDGDLGKGDNKGGTAFICEWDS